MSGDITILTLADDLLAMTERLKDDQELLDAARLVRAVAAEHQEVDARFQAAAEDLKRLLLLRQQS